MANQAVSKPASASSPFALGFPVGPNPLTATPGATAQHWLEYVTDACQRGVLYLDLLRRRGNEEKEMTARPMATVLHFDLEVLMSGRSLPKPINFALARIVPPPGVEIDPHKRPVVVVDPRAGQGPGIGGFKAQSEIGDALAAGHPVYFIGFAADPESGQQFLDVVEGQVKFFERVVELHPDAPRPFAIGNCQAGYQTLMVAMLRPDLFGPCLVAGAPMSYWQGVHGKNPMRYSGGLLGGSWLTALTSDLGKGKFDGTWLVLNFDNLNPANWLWNKQYDVYANVDTEGERYLGFEKWWGDFIQLGGDEMQFLVDELFVGDKLTRNQIRSSDGTTFDLRNVTSPIIIFTSMGDNISPPQQSLGWILDLYRDVDDVRASGQTIVYCLNQKVGHLAIFVSSKVAAKEDEEMVRLMDLIDCLPPGLYEMVISPRHAGAQPGTGGPDAWMSRFEARTLDDIRALGRNSEADDRAFAAVARMSELTHSIYRTFWQPAIRAMAAQPAADVARTLHPLRLSYTLFADSNPLMKGMEKLAGEVNAARRPAAPDNPFLQLQKQVSDRSSPRWMRTGTRATGWWKRHSSPSSARPWSRACSASIPARRSVSFPERCQRSGPPNRRRPPPMRRSCVAAGSTRRWLAPCSTWFRPSARWTSAAPTRSTLPAATCSNCQSANTRRWSATSSSCCCWSVSERSRRSQRWCASPTSAWSC